MGCEIAGLMKFLWSEYRVWLGEVDGEYMYFLENQISMRPSNRQQPVTELLSNEGKLFEVKEEVDHCIRENKGVKINP